MAERGERIGEEIWIFDESSFLACDASLAERKGRIGDVCKYADISEEGGGIKVRVVEAELGRIAPV